MNRVKKLLQLSFNDLKSKYSTSVLGVIWAFAMPLITILIFWVVFQLGFKNLPVGDAPYILWFSTAYIPWVFFADLLANGCNSLVEYSYLVKKIKFNLYYIPLMKIVSSFFVHTFFIIFLLVMTLIYGYGLSVYNIQILYYSFATAVLGLGLIWLLSSITVFFKDMAAITNIIIQIGFWVTPIMWNEDSMFNDKVKAILSINPMHYVINGYRESMLSYKWFWESPIELALFWGITLIILFVGWIVFKKLCPFFADEV